MVNVEIIITDKNVELPKYQTNGSAGFDLQAAMTEQLILEPGEFKMVNTGVKIHIGDPNYVGFALPRSGLGTKKGLVLRNSVGVIDSDYQGPLMLCLHNTSDEVVVIQPYDRIAQYVLLQVGHANLNVVEEFSSETDRGAGGFGSTGVKNGTSKRKQHVRRTTNE